MSDSESSLTLKSLLPLVLLLAGTAFLLLYTVDIRADTNAGISETLPSRLPEDPQQQGSGAWIGHEVLFCQRQLCGRSWLTRDLEPDPDGAFTCPRDWQQNPCGGELQTMSLGEKQVLPEETVITKKQYFSEKDPEHTVFCSVVFSGVNRNSIHRPEICMQGQGNTIESNSVIDIPIEGREPLKVMVLYLSRRISPTYTRTTYYAYWFVGKETETPHHLERILRMAIDRIFRNKMQRWAYIAVSGDRPADLNDTSFHEEIREVVGKMYPLIKKTEPSS